MCHVVTTNGEIFTNMQHVQLARLVYRRFGENAAAATAAWRRMLENDCPVKDFLDLVYYGEHTPACEGKGYCLSPGVNTDDGPELFPEELGMDSSEVADMLRQFDKFTPPSD